jgi:hypothetical protein
MKVTILNKEMLSYYDMVSFSAVLLQVKVIGRFCNV